MQVNKNTFIEVSDALEIGNPAIAEKDYYVVALLKLLSVISFDSHILVFSGGTALSKSGIKIHRMSEDVDIKLIPQNGFAVLSSRSARKKIRKQNHQAIIAIIKDSKLFSIEELGEILDEYRYQSINVRYPQKHSKVPCLRPFIKLEFIETELCDEVQTRSIISLTAAAYKEKAEIQTMQCSSILSTQAEKIVSMLRRTACFARDNSRGEDLVLIRHIYDTYYIQNAGEASVLQLTPLVKQVIDEDIKRYGNQHAEFVENPVTELRFALQLLEENSQFKDRFNQYVVPMVYGNQLITWDKAFAVFKMTVEAVLEEIDKS